MQNRLCWPGVERILGTAAASDALGDASLSSQLKMDTTKDRSALAVYSERNDALAEDIINWTSLQPADKKYEV